MHKITGKGTFVSPVLTDINGYDYIVIDAISDIDVSRYISILQASGLKVLSRCSTDIKTIKKISPFLELLDGVILYSDCSRASALSGTRYLRDNYPDLFLGFHAYRFPKLKDFPYFNFMARCDAVMPYFDISKVKDPIPQMRRILLEWRGITGKQIVPIIKPGENLGALLSYLETEQIDSVCLAQPNDIKWKYDDSHIFSGTVKGTSWLSVYQKPYGKVVNYYHAGDKVKVLEIVCSDMWIRSEKGWSQVIKGDNEYLEF